MTALFEPIVGRYMNIELQGRQHRLYVEEAGEGIPLLCLHTAGADGRQYRALLNDPAILAKFRVIAFDLPRHGKSSPPAGWQNEDYYLTTKAYIGTVMAVVDALNLDRPVVMGCSIGGRAVLHLALNYGSRFRAAIGLQSGANAGSDSSAQMTALGVLNRPDIHAGELSAALVAGIMSPTAPPKHKWETLWHYMQGGPGVFAGDLYYYWDEGDLRNRIAPGTVPETCPLHLLSGEYDMSAPPSAAREVAALFPGSTFQEMERLGHFPMSEDPDHFLTYLRPVLDTILARTPA
jgi:pimeloyl-ACP methyl ester carboxylesterase